LLDTPVQAGFQVKEGSFFYVLNGLADNLSQFLEFEGIQHHHRRGISGANQLAYRWLREYGFTERAIRQTKVKGRLRRGKSFMCSSLQSRNGLNHTFIDAGRLPIALEGSKTAVIMDA
jgi:hypothetical protein